MATRPASNGWRTVPTARWRESPFIAIMEGMRILNDLSGNLAFPVWMVKHLQHPTVHCYPGKIAIMRYGKMFRGDKVRHAQSRGAAAVILFNDPVEAAWLGQEAGDFANNEKAEHILQSSRTPIKCHRWACSVAL